MAAATLQYFRIDQVLAALADWRQSRYSLRIAKESDAVNEVQRHEDQRQKFRDLLAKAAIVAPGVYDGYSALLVQQAGFDMAATTGVGISNSLLGVDDIGVMGLSENVNHCRMLARTLSIPLTADADTGYGNPMNVHYTVQMFEEAGVAGVNIEDQVHPKRCGHMPGKEVIPLVEAAKKIEAACIARKDDAFAIIARTDALAIEGVDGMLKRARAYAEAGADLIFADAIRTEDQIKRLVDAARVPVTVIWVRHRSRPTTPLMSLKRLAEIIRRVTLPRMLPAAAISGMTRALEVMKSRRDGVPVDRPDLAVGIEDIMRLMDYDNMRELERRLLTTVLDVVWRSRGNPPPWTTRRIPFSFRLMRVPASLELSKSCGVGGAIQLQWRRPWVSEKARYFGSSVFPFQSSSCWSCFGADGVGA
jgi:2-methylisocitrate lyase-like PEP mutase family enzyme